MAVMIYHNPSCFKSCSTLALPEKVEVFSKVIEYVRVSFPQTETTQIPDTLCMEPWHLMRKQEAPYTGLNLGYSSLGRDGLIEAMLGHPILIKSPVVLNGGRYSIGRPPENVLEIR